MKANPALKGLKPFIGHWGMELSNASFLPEPSATIRGRVSFASIEDGAFVAMRQGTDATWVISRDEKEPNYTVLYADSRGVSRVYGMSLADRVWRIWRHSPGFSQRFEGTLSRDKKTVRGSWQKSFDGKHWVHDFDVTYRKVK
jgi:hypothetical protein